MLVNDPTAAIALTAALVLLLSVVIMRRRPLRSRNRPSHDDSLDTVASWPPEAARVLTAAERKAFEIVSKALPAQMVLAQVPLSRFLRVPTRHSYSQWVSRVGCLNADLLICDPGSRVLAVVDIRPANQSARGRQRHARMSRVLRAAQISVLTWPETSLPSIAEVRTQMIPLLQDTSNGKLEGATSSSRPLPLIPVAEMEEILAHGDALAQDTAMEPVSSTLFDDLDTLPATGTGGRR
jgi:Protein of unknown function (DUF2726)